jgi:hypothetical protein
MRGRPATSQAQMNVEEAVVIYYAITPPEIQAKIDLGEVDMRGHIHFMEEEVVDLATCAWILDTGSSHTQETKYF